MSLLSTITINYPHADFEPGAEFTMSTFGKMDEFTITEDGKLIDHQMYHDFNEEQYDTNVAEHGTGYRTLYGVLDTKHAGDKIIEDIHLDWHIWQNETQAEYVVRWNNGRVQYIRSEQENSE